MSKGETQGCPHTLEIRGRPAQNPKAEAKTEARIGSPALQQRLVYNWESGLPAQLTTPVLQDLSSALGFEMGEAYARLSLKGTALTWLHTLGHRTPTL